MAVEIERKFLVSGKGWRDGVSRIRLICQGYLSAKDVQVRVRRIDDQGWLTVKAERQGRSRWEFEYQIPVVDADALLALCPHEPIEKLRHDVPIGEHIWEIDVYAGRHEGLIVAEVELDHEGEAVSQPSWLGQEVTGDLRFSNVSLAVSGIPEI